MSDSTVLIVGGGPVGLVLACELRTRSLPVRIIDDGATLTAHSRAIVVWPRSMELLRRTGVAEPLAAQGHRVDDISFYSGGKHLTSVRLSRLTDTPYPYGTTIPQVRTEAVLRQRLAELGTEVEVGTTLVGLTMRGDAPVATLQLAAATTETVRPSWLIGADGARSNVREQLGIDFAAVGNEIRFAICDGRVTADLDPHSMIYSYRKQLALGLAPLGGGTYRVAFAVGPDREDDEVDFALFQQQLNRLSPVPATLSDLQWSTVFRARRRLASTFRRGRVFLAGDAAHIFSAAGAQGMNTGIQDAVSLGWRLAGVLRGELAESVLAGYEPERRAEAERLSTVTARQTEWGLLQRPVQRRLRDVAVRTADTTGLLQRFAAPLMSQTDVSYRTGRRIPAGPAGPLRPGDRLPVFARQPSGPAGGWPELPLDRPAVLLWPGAVRDHAWRHRFDTVQAVVSAATDDGIAVVDASGWRGLRARLGRRPAAVLLRPDGHVAAVVTDPRPSALLAALSDLGIRTAAAVAAPQFAGAAR